MKISEAITWAGEEIRSSSLQEYEGNNTAHSMPAWGNEAEILLENVLGMKRFGLLMSYEERIKESSFKTFKGLLRKRIENMPLSYIIGETEFMSLPFTVNQDVLIPRPETEVLVEKVLSALEEKSRVVDLGTGCGNIAVSLAKYLSCSVTAIDISGKALKIADINAGKNGVRQNVNFFCGNMFTPINSTNEKFDLVISNPPYVRSGEIPYLSKEVCNYEPSMALDGGKDGLMFYRIIGMNAASFLKPTGFAAVEVGYGQAKDVCGIFRRHFHSIEIIKDYSGIDRILIARKM